MNNAFRTDPGNPHVHWHVLPRYRTAPVVDGVMYEDTEFGEHYLVGKVREVSPEVTATIIKKLKEYI